MSHLWRRVEHAGHEEALRPPSGFSQPAFSFWRQHDGEAPAFAGVAIEKEPRLHLLFAHSGYWDHGGGPGPLGWAFFALLLLGLLAGVVALGVWLAGGRTARSALPVPAERPSGDDALAALRLRYARGEIAREEFLRASEDLGAAPPAEVGAAPPAEAPPP